MIEISHTFNERLAELRSLSDLHNQFANEIEQVISERNNWFDTAGEFSRNADFYRDLLDQTAQHLGRTVFVSDDGSVRDEPLRLKVPLLAERLKLTLLSLQEQHLNRVQNEDDARLPAWAERNLESALHELQLAAI